MSHVLSRDVPGHIFMSLSSNCTAGLRWEQAAALGPFMKQTYGVDENFFSVFLSSAGTD